MSSEDIHARYAEMSLPEACLEAGRLFEQVAALHLQLSLLYDAQHGALTEVQPANIADAFEGSFDETHLEISDCADRWRDAAEGLEGATVYFLAGADERGGYDRRLRGPYTNPSEPEEWMAGGYSSRAGIRVEAVEPADFIPNGGAAA